MIHTISAAFTKLDLGPAKLPAIRPFEGGPRPNANVCVFPVITIAYIRRGVLL